MTELKNKVIVVTGGCGLLGKAIVEYLTKCGAVVVTADIAADPSEKNQISLDITSEKSIDELIRKVISGHKKIDGWINNAYPRTKDWGNKLEDIRFESWQKNVDMHMNGYFLCCQKIFGKMKKQKSGSIVNMASIYGILGPDFTVYEGTGMTMPAAYSAIKGGIINFTKYLAAYAGPFGVRVNAVSPGGIFDGQPEAFVKNYTRKVPMKRMAKPEDIAPSVAFLLSDEASYITGHNLVADGGWSVI